MTLSVSPLTQLILATVMFLAGCGVLGIRPDRWKLALLLLLPASALTIWLVFGEELRELAASLLQGTAPAGAPLAPSR